ncbi:hypothetical protein B0A55_11077 [Friedmanniomyces simplex]|uniref:Uncharacterized protein n=1 Tax=Friedmanniomyces simplex TaxID=329884 RepID=A0A4U0WU87_9PEZI|nr:hypothetical protein B0A55_11077 [Friedmanniomyces simplex]
MDQSNSRTNKRQRDSSLASSFTGKTGKTGTTGPYDAQFQQLLIDQGVYPDGYRSLSGAKPPKPQNMEDIYRRLSQPRPSLSPSQFSEGAFEDFQDQNGAASSEQDVMTDVIPTIRGRPGSKFHNAGDTVFNNLAKFAPGIADAKPDGYDGARPAEIDPTVRNHLNGYIIPSRSNELPAAPNHLTEVKGPSGRADVLRRQATYAGAIGGRAMFELENYGAETPVYDGKAYTLVPAYNSGAGTLQVYATHPTQSATGRTEYHMTQLGSYAMTHSSDTFRQGAAAFRNSRDFSKEQRDRFLAAANATAAQRLLPVATPSSGTAGRSPVSSRTEGASFESNTTTDEPSPEAEEPPKRHRTRSAAASNIAESVQGRRRQAPQQGAQGASSYASVPSPVNSDAGHLWQGYFFRRLRGGNYEFKCTIHDMPQVMRAQWVPGQSCPQVYDPKARRWIQSSLEGPSLQIFARGGWITLGKEA